MTTIRLCTHEDWLKMELGERGYLDNDTNITITCVPNGWIYSESYYCERLDTMMTSNAFIPKIT